MDEYLRLIGAIKELLKLAGDLADKVVPPEKRDEAKAARKAMMEEWKTVTPDA